MKAAGDTRPSELVRLTVRLPNGRTRTVVAYEATGPTPSGLRRFSVRDKDGAVTEPQEVIVAVGADVVKLQPLVWNLKYGGLEVAP